MPALSNRIEDAVEALHDAASEELPVAVRREIASALEHAARAAALREALASLTEARPRGAA